MHENEPLLKKASWQTNRLSMCPLEMDDKQIFQKRNGGWNKEEPLGQKLTKKKLKSWYNWPLDAQSSWKMTLWKMVLKEFTTSTYTPPDHNGHLKYFKHHEPPPFIAT